MHYDSQMDEIVVTNGLILYNRDINIFYAVNRKVIFIIRRESNGQSSQLLYNFETNITAEFHSRFLSIHKVGSNNSFSTVLLD